MTKRGNTWQRIVRELFTHHKRLTPEELKCALTGSLKADTKEIEIHGHRIHWLEAGDGPPLVLVHGWTCSGYFWKPVIPCLKTDFRVLAPDLPGHGLSSKEEASYRPEAQAKRLLAWLTAIGVNRFVLVGHSMGGEIAARMALEAPDRIAGLVLAGAIGLKTVRDRLPWYARLSLTPAALKIGGLFFTERALARSHRLFMTGPGRPPYPECTRDVVLANTNTPHDLKTYTRTTRDGLFQSFLDHRLTEIGVPTLCLWGEADKLVPPEVGERFTRFIPHAHLTRIPGTGHMIPWEEPELMASEIRAFVKKTGPNP